ncbi:MAG TPA: hypothetical protein VKZ97_03835 [Flavobacteriaceae bacterium]|nr:hypothetical protein [Flavobacteriaceae bacterium]
MKHLYILVLCTLGIHSWAQQYATLEKNTNLYASSLIHELNSTKDTLYLKSNRKLTYIYSINEQYKREVDLYAGKQSYKIPLNTLSLGKHVFVVSETPRRIVFVVRINEEATRVEEVSTAKIAEVKSR